MLLVLAEFRCSEAGTAELRRHLERTQVRAVPGCLRASVWERPSERRDLFRPGWSEPGPATCRPCGASLTPAQPRRPRARNGARPQAKARRMRSIASSTRSRSLKAERRR